MRAIGFLIVLTIVGFGIYMVVSPANPKGPSGEDVKRETSEAFRATADYTKGKAQQLGEDTKEAAHNVKESTKENYQAAKEKIKRAFGSDYAYDQRESYQRELQSQLDTLRQKSHELENRLIQEGRKQEMSSELAALKETQQKINMKMSELSSVTKDTWEDFRDGIGDAMSELEDAFEDLSDKVERTAR